MSLITKPTLPDPFVVAAGGATRSHVAAASRAASMHGWLPVAYGPVFSDTGAYSVGLQVARDQSGFVHFRGSAGHVSTIAVGDIVCVLPGGFRPEYNLRLLLYASWGSAVVAISATTGYVTFVIEASGTSGAGGYVSFETGSFFAGVQ